jgi:hypothetical protein
MRSASGQGTVEYLALVLLVAIVLGGGTAAAARAGDADLAAAVPHQIRRALCIVTGGDCDDRAPCDVSVDTTASGWSATVAVFHLGHRRSLVVERRSDRSYVVTLTTAPSVGLQTIDGAHARIDRGRRRYSIGGALTASIVASLGHGRTWVLPDKAAAESLVARLERGDDVPADQELREATVVPGISASRTAGERVAATATGTLAGRASVGERIDHSTGRRTYFLEAGGGATLELTGSLRSLTGSASGIADGHAQLALTVDRDGRWRDLAVIGGGEVSGTASPPKSAGPLVDALGVPTSAGRRWIAEAHLNLRDPGNGAAAHAFVRSLMAVPPRPAATRSAAVELGRRVREDAVVDVRTYAVDRTASGFDVEAGLEIGLAAGHERSTEKTRLIAARTRGLDGRWLPRDDCLKEAHG